MSKQCAKCSKTVYPLEELKCLDKTWHKGCFKCWVCGMTLNMRTYKGFNKFPYCEAHIPKPKATTVAETPEFQRIAENTKIQSNVQYHADFEKAKGKYTTVADDPETMRIKEASKIISNVTYHGDLQKKAQMEMRRKLSPENGEDDNSNTSMMQANPGSVPTPNANYARAANKVLPAPDHGPMGDSPYSARQSSTVVYTSQRGPMEQPTGPQRHIGSIADYDPMSGDYRGQHAFRGHPQPQQHVGPATHQMHRVPQQSQRGYPPGGQQYPAQPADYYPPPPQQQQQQHGYSSAPASKPTQSLGNDSEDMSKESSLVTQRRAYTPWLVDRIRELNLLDEMEANQISRDTGPSVDSECVVERTSSDHGDGESVSESCFFSIVATTTTTNDDGIVDVSSSHVVPIRVIASSSSVSSFSSVTMEDGVSNAVVTSGDRELTSRCYRAMYDYAAADDDEVSFKDGDLIINCSNIDEGWMTGTVQRTMRTGMLPANYVEPAN
ncbi:unnamed protein product [Notodromas monacha]|uniref:LIM and SH3 domain protein Lasp n=1 Tax=Notodromas monacha TaxID=399045 RepID=A0A7R9GBW9_9CRUS|nr:unnamed protein product [Notodromas monacha]CAG0916849.1 unnamed protein product [Notodromas monacha]